MGPVCASSCAVAWLLSILTRNPLVGVGGPFLLGLLMQLLALLGGLGQASNALLTTPFASWHGLLQTDQVYGPLWQGALVSLVWAVPSVLVARRALLARDFT